MIDHMMHNTGMLYKDVLIIGTADISATDMLIFTVSVQITKEVLNKINFYTAYAKERIAAELYRTVSCTTFIRLLTTVYTSYNNT